MRVNIMSLLMGLILVALGAEVQSQIYIVKSCEGTYKLRNAQPSLTV